MTTNSATHASVILSVATYIPFNVYVVSGIAVLNELLAIHMLSVFGGAHLDSNGNDIEAGRIQVSGTLNLLTSVVTLTDEPMVNTTSWQISPSATLDASAATILNQNTESRTFDGGSRSYHTVINEGPVMASGKSWTIKGNNTFDTLEIGIARNTVVTSGSTQTITTSFVSEGTTANPIVLRASTAGSRFNISKSSGTVNVPNIDVKDSNATGGATWNAINSTNSGNNAGWNFVTVPAPTSNFTGSPTSGVVALAVSFTDTSTGSPTSWFWEFGDGSTSTAQNPSHTYMTPGSYTVKLTATNYIGSNTKTSIGYINVTANVLTVATGISSGELFGTPTVQPGPVTLSPTGIATGESVGTPVIGYNTWDVGGIATGEGVGAPTLVKGDPPPPPPINWEELGVEDTKEFVYKVYSKAGVFMRTWTDVIDELRFSQQILTPGTTTTVRLARSAQNTIEIRQPLVDAGGDPYTDSTGDPYVVTSTTSNTIGPDTDVETGLLVDIYAHYGGYEELVDENGEPYTDEDGDAYIVSTGAPLGRRVFSGKIMKYKAHYGKTEYVEVTLISHGQELTKGEVIKSGSATTVTYSSTEIGAIAKSILDTNPGRIGYTAGSIDNTAVSTTAKFELNTKLEGIKSLYSQTPDGWYWYGNVGENLLYMKAKGSTPDHVFIKGKHLSEIDIEKSAEDLRNKIYFVGGDTGSGILYKSYTDAPAIAADELGVHRITDRRYTLTASAQRYADKVMSEYGRAIWTSTISIASSVYDIESVQLGQMVGFRNFGNFVDTQILQIVGFNYSPTLLTLNLGTLQERFQDIITGIDEGLSNEQYQQIPSTPS